MCVVYRIIEKSVGDMESFDVRWIRGIVYHICLLWISGNNNEIIIDPTHTHTNFLSHSNIHKRMSLDRQTASALTMYSARIFDFCSMRIESDTFGLLFVCSSFILSYSFFYFRPLALFPILTLLLTCSHTHDQSLTPMTARVHVYVYNSTISTSTDCRWFD